MRDNLRSMEDKHAEDELRAADVATPHGIPRSQVLGIILLFALILGLAWWRFLSGL